MTPYTLTAPLDGRSPLLLASPHSGRHLPAEFVAGSRLPVPTLRRLEDAHVDALLAPAAARGVPLLAATHSRAVLDLNRAEDELDPGMFAGAVTPRPRLTERVRRGYGLFPRIAAPDQPIHPGRLPAAQARARIEALHQPWHEALGSGLTAARARHGHAVLLDVHSMPSLEGPLPAALVLGDRNGLSAAPTLVDWLESAFSAAGLKVVRNNPYAGGYITERHGAPATGIHAVQLEFDRALYMNPATLEPHGGFEPLAQIIAAVVEALMAALPGLGLGPALPLAAE
jgi:N-formylglutamate amidohydrolase